MKTIAAITALVLTAGPALSLSCMRPDPALSYTNAAEAQEAYLVVSGKLSHDLASVPERTGEEPITFPATLTGAFLKEDGFHGAFAAPVNVTVDCIMMTCGQMPTSPEAEVLAFLEETPTGYSLKLGPCGGYMFTDPTEAQLEKVISCHTGGDCTPES